MNWLEIVFLLLFFLFPLIQQILDQRKRGPTLPPREEDPRDVYLPEPVRRYPAPDAPTARNAESRTPLEWEGWSTAEELSAEEVVDDRQAAELAELQARMSVESVPEAVRVSTPVVSLESLVADRTAEHTRVHPRVASAPARVQAPAATLAPLLRNRRDLRRAILASEVLGPPRALQ